MWGQAEGAPDSSDITGIIPTRVGTSYLGGSFNNVHRDHPHACGDKVLRMDTNAIVQGSSPRVWGQGLALIGFLR